MTGVLPAPIRWADDADWSAFREVVRVTRAAFYGALIPPAELQAIHEGTLPVRRSWHDASVRPAGLLVTALDGGVVGGAELELPTDNVGELATFYVLPRYQGRGIGLALWEAASAALRDKGAASMQVWTMTAAAWSRRFYEQRGALAFAGGSVSVGDRELPHVGYRIEL